MGERRGGGGTGERGPTEEMEIDLSICRFIDRKIDR